MFDDFDLSYAKVNGVEINFRIKNNHSASENAILFLHGFPQTHAMWAGIADKFPDNYPIICSDLRGYGNCLLYTSPSPRDMRRSRMPSSA